MLTASLELKPGQEIVADRPRRTARRRRLLARGSGRRARGVRDPRRHRRRLPRRRLRSRCGSSSSATRSKRCATTIRPRSDRSAPIDQVVDRSVARRSRAKTRDGDDLRLSQHRERVADHRVGARRGRARMRSSSSQQIRESYDNSSRAGSYDRTSDRCAVSDAAAASTRSRTAVADASIWSSTRTRHDARRRWQPELDEPTSVDERRA